MGANMIDGPDPSSAATLVSGIGDEENLLLEVDRGGAGLSFGVMSTRPSSSVIVMTGLDTQGTASESDGLESSAIAESERVGALGGT